MVLLPGLHGTSALFERFLAEAPADIDVSCQPLPNEIPRGYDALADWLAARIAAEPVVLVAESFSGPLALLVAERCRNVVAVALVVSFVVAPAPGILARLPKRMWKISPPTTVVSTFLTGGDRALARDCRVALEAVPADVIAKRIDEAVHVDARAALARFAGPLLCISARQDWIVPRRSAATIRRLKPLAHAVELNGPHMLLQTRPAEAWSHLAPFVRVASTTV